MYVPEIGVLSHSNMYFNTPSSVAKACFYYLKCVGEFFCDSTYRVDRENFYSYLIMYVRKGRGSVSFDGKTVNVKENDLILLNTYKPHIYETKSGWETLWIHFDGNSSKQFYELLYERFGFVISLGESKVIQRTLMMVIDGYKKEKPLPEALVSSYIHRILSEIMLLSSNYTLPEINPVLDAITYIENNCRNKISINDVASFVKISPFHFSRIFKKETGYSPYEYIIKTRIDRAKVLLKQSKLQISEIAFQVGFNSESNFINTFKKSEYFTPGEFRNAPM